MTLYNYGRCRVFVSLPAAAPGKRLRKILRCRDRPRPGPCLVPASTAPVAVRDDIFLFLI